MFGAQINGGWAQVAGTAIATDKAKLLSQMEHWAPQAEYLRL